MTHAAPAPDFPTRPARGARWSSALQTFFAIDPRAIIRQFPEPAYEEPYRFALAFGLRYHLINDPDAIRHVLLDNAAGYRRPYFVRKLLELGVGQGLLTAEGNLWKEQRRLMAPVFTPAALERFMPMFLDAADRTAGRWPAAGGTLDVAAEATRTTREIIVRSLFSDEPSMSAEETGHLLVEAMDGVSSLRLGAVFGLPRLGRSKAARRGDAAQTKLTKRFAEVIRRRRAAKDAPHDFLALLLDAFAETHPDEAEKLARDNAVTFFGAGHETTAAGLAWALYLLAGDPMVQERARAEAIAALEGDPPPHESLKRLTYVRQVWEETLRLYPPAARIDREATKADELCGRRVRKGDMVVIWPWLVHRHRSLWANPDQFDPDNFSPEAKAGHHRFQYLPFGAGPRICIGMGFANAEAVLILARWLSRWRFAPELGHRAEVSWNVTVRPKGGLPMRVAPLA